MVTTVSYDWWPALAYKTRLSSPKGGTTPTRAVIAYIILKDGGNVDWPEGVVANVPIETWDAYNKWLSHDGDGLTRTWRSTRLLCISFVGGYNDNIWHKADANSDAVLANNKCKMQLSVGWYRDSGLEPKPYVPNDRFRIDSELLRAATGTAHVQHESYALHRGGGAGAVVPGPSRITGPYQMIGGVYSGAKGDVNVNIEHGYSDQRLKPYLLSRVME